MAAAHTFDGTIATVAGEFQAAAERARALMAVSRDSARALACEIANSRRTVAASKALLLRAAAEFTLPYVAATPARAPEPPAIDGPGPRTFAAVTELIERVEQASRGGADAADRLVADIKTAIESDTDPCMLMGILLEGIVEIVTQRLPAPARRDTVLALIGLLCDRASLGTIGRS